MRDPYIGPTVESVERQETLSDELHDRAMQEIADNACEAIDRISEEVLALKFLGQWP